MLSQSTQNPKEMQINWKKSTHSRSMSNTKRICRKCKQVSIKSTWLQAGIVLFMLPTSLLRPHHGRFARLVVRKRSRWVRTFVLHVAKRQLVFAEPVANKQLNQDPTSARGVATGINQCRLNQCKQWSRRLPQLRHRQWVQEFNRRCRCLK